MMSGMRNAPPISISSPRDTIASRPPARVLRQSSTAAALLFTTVASSAPVSAQSRPRTWSSRSPRLPVGSSNSNATGSRIAATAALIAASASTARPRLVCSTVPVRLNSGRSPERSSQSSRASASSAKWSAPVTTAVPSRSCARASANTARMASVEAARPKRCCSTMAADVLRTASTDGKSRRRAVVEFSTRASSHLDCITVQIRPVPATPDFTRLANSVRQVV